MSFCSKLCKCLSKKNLPKDNIGPKEEAQEDTKPYAFEVIKQDSLEAFCSSCDKKFS